MVNLLPKSWANAVATSCLLVIYGSLVLVSYWSFFDNAPPIVVDGPFIQNTDYVPGAIVDVNFAVDNMRVCHIRASRVIIRMGDGAMRELEVADREITQDEVGKTVKRTLTYTIPLDTVPGKYYLQSRGLYSCNPIQKIFPIVLNGPKAEIMVWGKS